MHCLRATLGMSELPEKSAFVVGNCDLELKNGSGFWGRGFIAGASYGGLEIKKALMNVGVVRLQER